MCGEKMYSQNVYSQEDLWGNPHFPHGYPQYLWVKGRVFSGFRDLSTGNSEMYKIYAQTLVCYGRIPFIFYVRS